MKADAFQDFAVRIIAEMDILERERAAANDNRLSARLVDDLTFRIDQVEHRCHIGQPLSNSPVDHAKHIERAKKLGQQRVHKHYIARCKPALRPTPDRVTHRPRQHQVGNQRLSYVQQCKRVFGLDRRTRPLLHHRAIRFTFAALGVEVFDCLVIEQAVDRASNSAGIQLVHLLAQFVAPVGDPLRKENIYDDHDQRRRDQFPAELEVEYGRYADQLDYCRRDIEQ